MKRYESLIVAALLAIGVLALSGSNVPDVGLGDQLMVGMSSDLAGGSSSDVEQVVLFYGSHDRPNTAVFADGLVDSTTFTAQYKSADGTHFKYGYVREDAKTTIHDGASDYYITFQCTAAEDDIASTSFDEIALNWFSLSGLQGYARIDSAKYFWQNLGTMNVNASDVAGRYYAIRGDTVVADYITLATTETQSGFAQRWAFTYDLADTSGTAWNPILGDRHDWHDWGPRSGNVLAGPASYSAGTCHEWDVTDIIQQIVDNGEVSRGVILLPYGTDQTLAPLIACGTSPNVSAFGRGSPCLVVWASKPLPPSRPWNGDRVPLVMTWDDCSIEHAPYYAAATARGYKFDSMVYAAAMQASAAYRAFVNGVYGSGNLELHHHSWDHTNLGVAAGVGGDYLRRNIYRGNAAGDTSFYAPPFFTTEIDTADIQHYAWPGGALPTYTLDAMTHFVNAGYRSARAATMGDTTRSIGQFWASWEQPFNRYAVGAFSGSAIWNINSGSEPSLRERLTDYIDLCYTTYGKSALVLYSHNAAIDSASAAKIDSLITIAETLNSVRIRSYDEMINMRISGAEYLDLSAVTQANGYSRAWAKTAAMYDSLGTANSDPNIDTIWFKGK